MTEKEYRELPNEKYFSSSFIKMFDTYGAKHLIDPKVISNDGIKWGSIVDTLAFSDKNFDDIYYVSQTEKDLTATELKLYKAIIGVLDKKQMTKDYLNSSEFVSLCLSQIEDLNLWNNIKDKDLLKEKINSNFINHILEYTIADSREIISSKDFLDAKYTYKILKTHDFTSKYFTSEDIEKKQLLFQIPILYKIEDDHYKSLLDIILIDNKEKTIRAVDLKTGALPNKYFISEFFKRRYDIQGFLYTKALEEYIILNNLKDYRILDPVFVYTCRSTPNTPLPFEVSRSVTINAYCGFITYYGKKYKGVKQLVEEIKWHRKMNIYDYTMEEYENKKIVIDDHNINVNDRISSLPGNMFSNYGRLDVSRTRQAIEDAMGHIRTEWLETNLNTLGNRPVRSRQNRRNNSNTELEW